MTGLVVRLAKPVPAGARIVMALPVSPASPPEADV